MIVYLGEKVVSEKEYLSAMAVCNVVQRRSAESQGTWRGRTAFAGCEMDVSLELDEALGNRMDAAAVEHGPCSLHVTSAKPSPGRLSLRIIFIRCSSSATVSLRDTLSRPLRRLLARSEALALANVIPAIP